MSNIVSSNPLIDYYYFNTVVKEVLLVLVNKQMKSYFYCYFFGFNKRKVVKENFKREEK